MSGGLVRSRVETEVQHECALVFGCNDIGTTECVRHVIAEERGFECREDADTMSLQLQGVNGFSFGGVHKSLGRLLGREGLVLVSIGSDNCGIEGHSVIGHDITVRF